MSSKNELFNLRDVVITEERMSVGHRSFSMESIRNVEVVYHFRTWSTVVGLLVTAANFEAFGLSLGKPGLQLGALALLILAGVAFWIGGPRYSLALETEQGRINPIHSADRFFVEAVGQTMQMILGRSHEYAGPRKVSCRPAVRRNPVPEIPPFRVLPGKRAQQQSMAPLTMQPRLFAMSTPASTNSAIR